MLTELRKILPTILVGLLLSVFWSGFASADGVAYQKANVLNVWVHVVTADLRDPAVYVTIGLPKRGVGHAESFRSILRRTQPAAAITGTFFDTRSLRPVGDLVICGAVVHQGCVGTGLAINSDNQAKLVPFEIGRASNWRTFETVLCAGPRLVSNGAVCVNPKAEGFRDRRLFARHRRPAIGVTANGELLLAAARTPVTFSELAKVMRTLGAVEAVGLDGGGSTALYYNGDVIVSPYRKLTNVLLVYTDQQLRAETVRQRAKQKQVIMVQRAQDTGNSSPLVELQPHITFAASPPVPGFPTALESSEHPADLPISSPGPSKKGEQGD